MRKTKNLNFFSLVSALIVILFWSCQSPSETPDPELPQAQLNKGSEFLGEPDYTIAPGSGYLVAGIGLEESQPGIITFSLPENAIVRQVILYWSGGGTGNQSGDETVTIAGNNGVPSTEITGTLIGGPTPFFPDNSTSARTPVYFSSFYGDITEWFFQGSSMPTEIHVSEMNYLGVGYGPSFNENNGAFLIIIYDDGSRSSINIKDGLDVAWIRSSTLPPYSEQTQITSQIILTFPAENFDREAAFFIFAATVDKLSGGGSLFQGDPRPNRIDITVGGNTYSYQDELGSFRGYSLDVWEKNITVPAGIASAEIRLFSTETDFTLTQPKNNANGPASLTWIAAGVSVPEIVLGCTKSQGYWKNHSYYGPAPYDPIWENLLNDPPSGLGDYMLFFNSDYTYYDVMHTPTRGNAYFILAPQYVAAILNKYSGAYLPPVVRDALEEAENLFDEFTPAQVKNLRGNDPIRKEFIKLAGLLDKYNNGQMGVPSCD